jgi:hypothetical protein
VSDAGAAGGRASDAGVAADGGSDAGGDGGMCANLVCLSIFDCVFYHGAQYTPCKITRCDNFLCKP